MFSAGSSAVAKSASACSYRPPLWPIEEPAIFRFFTYQSDVGLVFRHCHCAIFGALFLPETCFGTRPGLILVVNVFSYSADKNVFEHPSRHCTYLC